MATYSEYKDSGQTWLGEIPSHWTIRRSGTPFQLTERICRGLEQVKLIREGKAKGYTVDELLNEL